MGVVQKDLGTEYSETFIVTGVHKSAEAAWEELGSELAIAADRYDEWTSDWRYQV